MDEDDSDVKMLESGDKKRNKAKEIAIHHRKRVERSRAKNKNMEGWVAFGLTLESKKAHA